MDIKRITSFEVDHTCLVEGMYVSRVDGDITTFDLRTRRPNAGDYMDNVTMHTFEHLFATYARNTEYSENIIYVGPMGCQTGFYLLVRDASEKDTLDAVKDTLSKIIMHEGDMFGAKREECGNYRNLDLTAAKNECRRYLSVLESKENDFKYRTAL